jgi:DNA-binding response OmpR family regulator
MKQILLVEDDHDIAGASATQLKMKAIAITHEPDGGNALQRLEKQTWDAVILDLMLPNVDGLEICRRIRQMTRYLPVIIISARSSETDRITGLETGADDYLAKPFSVQELIARIKALFRRQQAMGQAQWTGIFRPRADHRSAGAQRAASRRVVDLTPREFELLYFFARHPGEVFSRLALLEQVWGYQHEGYEHTVNTHINRLRIKMRRTPPSRRSFAPSGARAINLRSRSMMRRFSLSQRLTLLFILLMMLCAAVACAVQLYSSTQYGNAMVQRLSGGLAQQIVQREPILDAQGRVDRSALKPLFDRLMTFNPSVELYVVSPDGDILADAAAGPYSAAKNRSGAGAELPERHRHAGTGRRSAQSKSKVFSATPLRQDGELKAICTLFCRARSQTRWRKWPGTRRCGAPCCGRCCGSRCLGCWQGCWSGTGSRARSNS